MIFRAITHAAQSHSIIAVFIAGIAVCCSAPRLAMADGVVATSAVPEIALHVAPLTSSRVALTIPQYIHVFIVGELGAWYAVTVDNECIPVYFVSSTSMKPTTHVRKLNGKETSYASPDGSLKATVTTVTRLSPYEDNTQESCLLMSRRSGAPYWGVSYLSANSNCGFEIYNVAWTANSRFLVMNLRSSAGHQPWHIWTNVYDRHRNSLESLEDHIGTIGSGFRLAPPDIIHIELYGFDDHPNRQVTFRLSHLPTVIKHLPVHEPR